MTLRCARSPRSRRPRLAAALIVVGVLVLGAGCTATQPSPPTGVDGLTVPMASPEPAAFVAVVDNPWLALPTGPRRYQVADGEESYPLEVTVSSGPTIAGVATTAVRSEPQLRKRQRPTLVASTDYYAQDRAGNVWWFGREGEWQVGEAGAEAGLVMPAAPRRGDGFRLALAPGIDVRAEVTEHDPEAGVLRLTVTSGSVVRFEEYAEGVGLVSMEFADAAIAMGLATD